MLYVSARNKQLTYTAFQALTLTAASDGGMLVPLRLPFFDKTMIKAMAASPFEDVAVNVLNKFFPLSDKKERIITCLKEAAPSYSALDRKTLYVNFGVDPECTHNQIEKKIYNILSGTESGIPTMPLCAIRVSLLVGMYLQLRKLGVHTFDIAVCSKELDSYLPVVFSKEMGVPVNKIICGSDSEDGLWNYMRKDTASEDIFMSVVSEKRANELIYGVEHSYNCTLNIFAAFAYGALQDYRAVTGENATTIIIN